MDIISQWNEKRASLLALAEKNKLSPAAVAEQYGEVLDALRLGAMAGQTNPIKQQLIGLLFTQARQDTEWLEQLPALARAKVAATYASGANTPAGKHARKLAPAQALLQRLLKLAQNPLFALVALGVVFVLTLIDKSYSAAAIAALLFAAQYIANDPFGRGAGEAQVAHEPQAYLELDANVLLSTLDAHIQTLQHRLDDLAILDDRQKADAEAPLWLLQFIQSIWEASLNAQHEDCENLCAQALLRFRLKPVAFDGSNDSLFKWLRSSGETLMIYPAIVRADGGAPVQLGKAISPNA
jgi:hypothetical protein